MLPLVWVLGVADAVLICKGLRCLSVVEAARGSRRCGLRLLLAKMGELALARAAWSVHADEGLVGGRSVPPQKVLARVDVGVAERIGNELSERFVSILARRNCHLSNFADGGSLPT